MLIAKVAKVLTWHKDGKSILFMKDFFKHIRQYLNGPVHLIAYLKFRGRKLKKPCFYRLYYGIFIVT